MKRKWLLIIISVVLVSSCSLNYGDKKNEFDKMPNFVFKDASLDRYEDDKVSLKIKFEELEVYDQDKIWVGKKIHFTQINKNAKSDKNNKSKKMIESKGYAGLIKIDEEKEQYFLGEKVFFEDVKEKLLISGKAFFWDKNAGLLYAPSKDIISIKKADELYIKGSGFIANTISREFEFSNSIEGTISTEKNEPEQAEKNDSEGEKNE